MFRHRLARLVPAVLGAALLALLFGCSAAPAAVTALAGATPAPRIAAASDALTAYLDSLPGKVSVVCLRVADGLSYQYQPDETYYAASLLKAPYALWLCRRAEAGEIDLDTALPARGAAPRQTARQAMHAMISRSDDSATGQLYSR